jgi:histidine phosphotransferase ChpT
MTDLEFSAYLVSRVCHDLVGPLGAVVNGLEVLEEERDASMRADALKVVATSAAQALARLQFMRLAFGAAGSAGTELALGEVHRLIAELLDGGRISVAWQPPAENWPKDWAKLLMNGALLGADCLPRGGELRIETASGKPYGFKIVAAGNGARVSEETARALGGEASVSFDARGIQPVLACKIAKAIEAKLTAVPGTDRVEILAG